jgi:2,3-bisphosphoglycerate-dependent phosphoglycerate mutase
VENNHHNNAHRTYTFSTMKNRMFTSFVVLAAVAQPVSKAFLVVGPTLSAAAPPPPAALHAVTTTTATPDPTAATASNRRAATAAGRVRDDDVSHEDVEGYEVYSRSLSPRQERKDVLKELDRAAGGGRNSGRRWWPRPSNIFPRRNVKPGKLILLRCGESTFNANGTFTGWLDPDLTSRGVQQCEHTAALLQSEGYEPDVVYTSRLKRAIKSTWVILEAMETLYIPVHKTFRLNQRMYGALQGLSKETVASEVGWNAVNAWRNSIKARPPKLSKNDPTHPCKDRRYADLSYKQIPCTESLRDCQERARPLWEHKIRRDIEQGKTVLVVAHRDALRGLVKNIDCIDDVAIEDVRIPKCIPFVYRFEVAKGGSNDGALQTIKPDPECTLTQKYTNSAFLETPASLKKAVLEQKDDNDLHLVGGSVAHGAPDTVHRDWSLIETLARLRSEFELNASGSDASVDDEDDKVDLSPASASGVTKEGWWDDPSEFEEYEYDEFSDEENQEQQRVQVTTRSVPKTGMQSLFKEGEAFVVLIRHGRTPHNNLGLFTGWEDPPLAEGGVEDARNAGRILKR